VSFAWVSGPGRLNDPRVPTISPIGRNCQSTQSRTVRADDRHATAGPATTCPILDIIITGESIHRDRSGSTDGPGPDKDQGPSWSTPAIDCDRIIIFAGSPTATAHHQAIDRHLAENGAAITTDRKVRVPGISSLPADCPIASTTTT